MGAWIYYTPIELTDTRTFKPLVLCVPLTDEMRFEHCADHSWTKLDIDWMHRPIFFGGDLSDDEVKKLYDAVDRLKLVSRTDNRLITSDRIRRIWKSKHAGNRVNVEVTTEKKGFTDAIYLSLNKNGDGLASFELSDFRCGTD